MKKEKKFQEVIKNTRELIREFEKSEQKKWGIEGSMMELMKQVGELSRCVMMYEKYYISKRKLDPRYKMTKDNIGDELYDIFFMLVRIADHYGINLEKECEKAVKNSLKYLFESKKK